jgi:hypothetical protein
VNELKTKIMHSHNEIVKKLIDSKAVDFNSIGKMVTELGPASSFADDPWDHFCGTMRRFIHIYRLPGPLGQLQLENLEKLGKTVSGLK